MMGETIREHCACGAYIEVSMSQFYDAKEFVKEWRANHHHELPQNRYDRLHHEPMPDLGVEIVTAADE
jgi:hypothetical protein